MDKRRVLTAAQECATIAAGIMVDLMVVGIQNLNDTGGKNVLHKMWEEIKRWS